jgi:hypothetical protein
MRLSWGTSIQLLVIHPQLSLYPLDQGQQLPKKGHMQAAGDRGYLFLCLILVEMGKQLVEKEALGILIFLNSANNNSMNMDKQKSLG